MLKLYVIGLSIDLSYLEKVKYGEDSNRDEFLIVHKRLYLVLLVLGYIIEDLPLRRLCVEAANVCEFTTNNSMLILEQLPVICSNNVKCSAGKLKIYNDLRSLLGNIKSAIKINKKLIEFYERSSVKSYENLEYLNKTRVINTELTSIIYPGIERGTRKIPKAQENGHHDAAPRVDFHRVRKDNENFLKDISQRFKLLYDPFETLQGSNLLISPRSTLYEIRQVFMNQLNNCMDFHIKPNDLFFVMSSITVEQIMDYHQFLNDQITLLVEQNAKTLYFDFDIKKSDAYKPIKCDIAAAYNEGIINVWDLSCDTNNIFDIENIMFYAIHLKKVHCSLSDFPKINRNCSIPPSLPFRNTFCFLVFREHPSYKRISGIKILMSGAFSFLDVINKLFDCDMVKFKCYRKKITIESAGIYDFPAIECSNINSSVTETSVKVEVKRKAPRSNRKEAQSNVIDSTTSSIQNLEMVMPRPLVQVKKEPTTRYNFPKANIQPMFDGRDDIDMMLLLLENEISLIMNSKAVLVIVKKSSFLPLQIKGNKDNIIHSQVTIKMEKFRGTSREKLSPVFAQETQFKLSFPFLIYGSVKINVHIMDSIVYNNSLKDDPKIDTKIVIRTTGNLMIDQLTSPFSVEVQGLNVTDSSIKFIGKPSYRKPKPKRVTFEPVIVQQAPINVDGSGILLDIKKEEEDEDEVIESINETTMNYTFDQYEQHTEFVEQTVVEESLNDVEMPLSVKQEVVNNEEVVTLEPMNISGVELIQQAAPSQTVVKEIDADLKFDVFTDINQPDPCTMITEQTEVIMPTISDTMEMETKPEPELHEPQFYIQTFEHNDDHNKSNSLELVNLQTTSISPKQDIPQHIINCDMNVPHRIENELDVKPSITKLNHCFIDLTDDNDNDKHIPNFSFENRALRTYSKLDVGKTLLQHQSKVNCEAIDFESMMPSVQLMIPDDLLNNEAERARWRCEMTKHKDLPVKSRHRPGPACHSKSKRKSGESNRRPLLHSVNRNSNAKNTKKCSVVLFNCLQDVQFDDLRSNVDIWKNKVNVQLPASVSLTLITVYSFDS